MGSEFFNVDDLDISKLINPDVETFEEHFSGGSIFKFLSFSNVRDLERFSLNPTIKFAIKGDLNDSFELSARYDQLMSARKIEYMSKYLEDKIRNIIFSDKNTEKYIESELLPQLSRSQKKAYRAKKKSGEYAIFLGKARTDFENQITPRIKPLIEAISESGVSKLDALTATLGVSSFTDDAENQAMWSLYADKGSGFVIEYNTDSLPKAPETSFPRIRKVKYETKTYEDFFENPYSLFLTKDHSYSFEREWREIAKITDLESIYLDSGRKIYFRPIPRGGIRSIIKGYAMEPEISNILDNFKIFDDSIEIKSANINMGTRKIDIICI